MGGGGLETKHRKAEKDCGWGEVWRRNIGKQRKIVDGGGGGLETKHRKAGKDCGWGGVWRRNIGKQGKIVDGGGGSGDET